LQGRREEKRREESELLQKIDKLKNIHESNLSNETLINLENAKEDIMEKKS